MKKYWTNLNDLIVNGQIETSDNLENVAKNFQIRVSHAMQKRIGKELNDPIALQFIPSLKEAIILDKELDDPIGDYRYSPVEGVVHRYEDRALLKVTQLCEVYCRFCFRKEMIGNKGEVLNHENLERAYSYFKNHSEIWEVILTGGDPLILSNRYISEIVDNLIAIDHIKNIRIHTRIPIVNPSRVDDELLSILKRIEVHGKSIVMAIHANHKAEFGEEASLSLKRLRKAGVILLSQSVLLRGVNDSFEALADLMRTFICYGIKPYYLHQMDLARGTSHFVVESERAISLIRELREKLSGILVPTLIEEIPEGKGKRVLY